MPVPPGWAPALQKVLASPEAQRLAEKEEEEARVKRREEDLRARKKTDETIYEITLKLAEKEGLPAPYVKTNATTLAAAPKAGSNNKAAAVDSAAAVDANAAAAPKPVDPDDDDNDLDTPPAPDAVDTNLTEAEHILIDYVGMLSPRQAALSKDR